MGRDIEQRLDELARRQHGLVSSQQAIGLLGRSRKDRWAASGRLVPVQPRVWRLAGAPESWPQALAAAQMSALGVVSHRSAAEMWGMLDAEGTVEVSVRPPRQPRLWRPGTAHRILDLDAEQAVLRNELMVTDPIRTIIDLGLVVPSYVVHDALSAAVSKRLLRDAAVRHLRDHLARRGRNGTGVADGVLRIRALSNRPEDSVLEGRLVRLIHRYALPVPKFQFEVWHDGRFVARIDAAYPEERLGIEVDGFEPHSRFDGFQKDRSRSNQLVELGWTLLHFTWPDVTRRPSDVAARIRRNQSRLELGR
jgi:very-short-patch-repair endonuclease